MNGPHQNADDSHRPAHTNLKLHASTSGFYNTVTSYGDGFVEVNERRFVSSILVMPEGDILPWNIASFDALVPLHFEQVLALGPELVVFGSGAKLRFVHPRILAPLHARRIGVETMDMFAACRTYNILMGEGRKAALALLIEPVAASA